jgi:hypothetical protein
MKPTQGPGKGRFRMQSVHLGITGFCALVSVVLAAVQTFRSEPEAPPVAVQVVVPEAPKPVAAAVTQQADMVNASSKQDSAGEVGKTSEFQSVAMLTQAKFQPATRADVVERFPLKNLFDANPTTLLTIAAPDSELDFIVELPMAEGAQVAGIEISAPEGIGASAYAGRLEVMVLPDGTMGGSGRDVESFPLQPGLGVQSFALKPQLGRALWIRIAGQPGALTTIVGDVRVLTSLAN